MGLRALIQQVCSSHLIQLDPGLAPAFGHAAIDSRAGLREPESIVEALKIPAQRVVIVESNDLSCLLVQQSAISRVGQRILTAPSRFASIEIDIRRLQATALHLTQRLPVAIYGLVYALEIKVLGLRGWLFEIMARNGPTLGTTLKRTAIKCAPGPGFL